MSELDTEARSTGNAAVQSLRSALETAEFRVRRFSAEGKKAQAYLQQAQCQAAELKEALSRLQGGDGHGS